MHTSYEIALLYRDAKKKIIDAKKKNYQRPGDLIGRPSVVNVSYHALVKSEA